MDPVRIAAVGVGRWANVLADAYTPSPDVQLVTCYNRSPEKGQAFAQKYGCEYSDSLEALLQRDDIEGVIVTVPNDHHASVIEQVARAGKHVYVEKPIAVDLQEALLIERVVNETGITFMCGHSARRLGGLRKMKEMKNSGALGQVSTVEAVFSNERGLELKPGDWRGNPEKSPGGPLTQLGVHQIDNMQYLMGPVKQVFTMGKPMYTKVSNSTVLQTLVEFEDGTMGYLGTNWACPGSFTFNMYGTTANLFYELDFGWWSNSDVTDEHSSLLKVEFEHLSDDPDNRTLAKGPVQFSRTNHLRDEIEEFAQAIRGEAVVEVGARAAVLNVAVVLAGVRSNQENRPVEIQEILEG